MSDEEGSDKDVEQGEEKAATLEEYITMVAAGLAGASPHMISATITALSRLLYEYKEELPRKTLDEIVATVEVLLRSANREIVKSALGCVKVVIVGLEHSLLEQHLAELVAALLGFSPANKQHFKGKVRHIFERLLRRFGFARIDALTDDDNKKLIQNIRKRKERARRKKAARDEEGETGAGAGDDEDDDDQQTAAGRRRGRDVGVDAFEDALYGSDSDASQVESDQDDAAVPATAVSKKGRKKQQKERGQAYIVEDDDEPMDLLDRSAAAGSVLTRRPNAAQGQSSGQGKKKEHFRSDAETGKLMIREDGDESDEGGQGEQMDVDGAGDAFTAKERGADGFKIGKGGSVRFNKNTKRMRADEAEWEEMLDEAEGGRKRSGDKAEDGDKRRKRTKQQKPAKTPIGAEFKAKRAQGDVTKKGVSPYAYGESTRGIFKRSLYADQISVWLQCPCRRSAARSRQKRPSRSGLLVTGNANRPHPLFVSYVCI